MIAFRSIEELPMHLQPEFQGVYLPDLSDLADDQTIKVFFRGDDKYRVIAAISEERQCFILKRELVVK
jgi:hypothetical protein